MLYKSTAAALFRASKIGVRSLLVGEVVFCRLLFSATVHDTDFSEVLFSNDQVSLAEVNLSGSEQFFA